MADQKEIIDAQAVLQGVGSTSVQPTFVQRPGLWLAAGVGSVIAIVTLSVVIFLYLHYPSMPSEFVKDMAGSKDALERYKELSGIAIKSAQDLFQTIVTQALLPVLTLILGYIFGKGGRDDGGE